MFSPQNYMNKFFTNLKDTNPEPRHVNSRTHYQRATTSPKVVYFLTPPCKYSWQEGVYKIL